MSSKTAIARLVRRVCHSLPRTGKALSKEIKDLMIKRKNARRRAVAATHGPSSPIRRVRPPAPMPFVVRQTAPAGFALSSRLPAAFDREVIEVQDDDVDHAVALSLSESTRPSPPPSPLLLPTPLHTSSSPSSTTSSSSETKIAECCVCLDKPSTHIVLPCGHMCLCETCSLKCKRAKLKCPKCCGTVRQISKVFL